MLPRRCNEILVCNKFIASIIFSNPRFAPMFCENQNSFSSWFACLISWMLVLLKTLLMVIIVLPGYKFLYAAVINGLAAIIKFTFGNNLSSVSLTYLMCAGK